MGIIISALTQHPAPSCPGPVRITLECDAATEMFCRGVAHFEHADGFVGAHALAMAGGWLERNSSQGRLWLCPECSGKPT